MIHVVVVPDHQPPTHEEFENTDLAVEYLSTLSSPKAQVFVFSGDMVQVTVSKPLGRSVALTFPDKSTVMRPPEVVFTKTLQTGDTID